MGEPFKHLIGPPQVASLAAALGAAWAPFPLERFARDAGRGLGALELKARARHVCDALEGALPDEPRAAFAVIVRALGARAPAASGEGYVAGTGFALLPLSEYLERHGAQDVEAALVANRALTERFTSEFCVRALLEAAPDRTLGEMARWAVDPSEHVRRLVSEGTRPRLPWGRRLTAFVRDPAPVLPLLERLRDDPSEYVRRSVANNLNDIAKDHPTVVLDVCARWLEDATPARRRLVEHALRTLLKRGEPRALGLVGAGIEADVQATATVGPPRVRVGDAVRVEVSLRNRGAARQHVIVEARVHFVSARGTSPKTFRVARLDLGPGEARTVSKSLPMEHRSIRTLYPGEHAVDVQVNGRARRGGSFVLLG